MHAARAGRAQKVLEILKSDPKQALFVDDTTGLTPLHLAATAAGTQPDEQYLMIVRALIENKADVNAQDRITQMSPLLFAVRAQKPKLVNILLENGADARSILDTRRWSALHFAVGEGGFGAQETKFGLIPPDSAILKMILNAKAVVDGRNNTGSTALHLACRHEKAHLAQILLLEQYQCRPSLQDINMDTPLHFAATMPDKPNALKALLERRANVNLANIRGQTPLHIAAMYNNDFAVQELLRYGADPNIVDTMQNTPARIANSKGYAFVEALLEKSAQAGGKSTSTAGVNGGGGGGISAGDGSSRKLSLDLGRLGGFSGANSPGPNGASTPTSANRRPSTTPAPPLSAGKGKASEPALQSPSMGPKTPKGVTFAADA